MALDYFEQLGNAVARAWETRDLDERAFPDIAVRALEDAAPPASLSLDALIHDALTCDAARLIPQHDIDASFANPLTVYSHRRFHIAVNTWLDASTAIHEHGFTGAFRVLQGSSIHGRYRFTEREAINSHLRIGELGVELLELLEPGEVRRIDPRGSGAHALFHLDRPSVTIVIRTHGETAFSPQLMYLMPGLAIDTQYFEAGADVVLKRRGQLLNVLLEAHSEAFASGLRAAAEGLDAASVFELLRTLMPAVADHVGGIGEALAQLGGALDVLNARRPTLGAIAPAVLADIARRTSGLTRRRAVRAFEHRFVLGALLNAPDRARVLQLIRARFAGTDPEVLLGRWLDELLATPDPDDATINVLGLGPDSSQVLRRMVRGASSFDQLRRELADDYSPEALAAAEPDLRHLHADLIAHSICRPLFR